MRDEARRIRHEGTRRAMERGPPLDVKLQKNLPDISLRCTAWRAISLTRDEARRIAANFDAAALALTFLQSNGLT